MGIDIFKLNESELLSTLGDGDWQIMLPDNHPDIIIRADWREQHCANAAHLFVRWVIEGISVDIEHDSDPSWDQSGSAYKYQVDPLLLLTRYSTLQEWLDEAYTGNSTASFESGMGLYWDTYENDVSSDIDDEVFELIKSHLQMSLNYDEDDDIWMEILDEATWVQSAITHAIMLSIGLLSTEEVWKKFHVEVQIELAEEQRQAEERAIQYRAMRETVREFWALYFADLAYLKDQTIDKPTFKALDLANRLRQILNDADPDIAESILAVGPPGRFSNSVSAEIHAIAEQALQ